jgi:hypothetical protein
MRFSFHCTDITGHLRIGSFCFAWRNGYMGDPFYHAFGESKFTLGERVFHFYSFPWKDN